MPNLNRNTGLQIKEGIFDNVPHVMIGDDGKLGVNRQQPIPQPPPMRPPYQQPTYPLQPRQPKQPEDLIDKLKKYALIFFTILILGAVGVMVVQIVLGRFF